MSELDTLSDLIRRARAAGADAADAVVVSATSVSVQRRLRKTEQVVRAEGHDLGLRVFIGNRSASVSSSAVDPASFDALVSRAIAMARIVPEDPYAGLAEEARPPEGIDLDMDDGTEPALSALTDRAARAEEAALSVTGVTNSEGADAGYSRAHVAVVTSAGFAGQVVRSSHSVSATALAGEGTGMERDYDYSSAVHLSDLEDPRDDRPHRGREGHRAAEPDPSEDDARSRRLRSACRQQHAGSPLGRDQWKLDRARHQLSQGANGSADLRPWRDRDGRSAPSSRPPLA